jgi:hypothetical protein
MVLPDSRKTFTNPDECTDYIARSSYPRKRAARFVRAAMEEGVHQVMALQGGGTIVIIYEDGLFTVFGNA